MARTLQTAGRNARVIRLGKDLLTILGAVAETSKLAALAESLIELLRHTWDSSATESGSRQVLAASGRFFRGSRFVGGTLNLTRPLDAAIDGAAVTYLARRTEAAVRASWLYRWLTAEPDSEIIVIDLRDSVSVGPAIATLEQLIRWLIPASHRSTVRGAVGHVHRSVTTAPIQVASLLLGVVVMSDLGVALWTGEPTEAGLLARMTLLGVAALGTRVSMDWNELVETRPVRLLVAALEPPEPPDNRDE